MSNKTKRNSLTLVGLDIEGEWNLPLLKNAADISGASVEFAKSGEYFTHLQKKFDRIIACETSKKSRSIYDFPALRGRIAIIVGNEQKGIPKNILRKVDQVVSIPMYGKNMSSVNVAVAAAIALYSFKKDFARNKIRKCKLIQKNIDILLLRPENPNEIGSLFRSIWAFGWRHVFLADDNNVWFTKDKKNLLAGRAAARREINPLAVIPAERIDFGMYDHIYLCNSDRSGTPLSKLTIHGKRKILIIYGAGKVNIQENISVEEVYADFCTKNKKPCFRHEGSALLSVVSEMVTRRHHG